MCGANMEEGREWVGEEEVDFIVWKSNYKELADCSKAS